MRLNNLDECGEISFVGNIDSNIRVLINAAEM
jgi:hypothetical protein